MDGWVGGGGAGAFNEVGGWKEEVHTLIEGLERRNLRVRGERKVRGMGGGRGPVLLFCLLG